MKRVFALILGFLSFVGVANSFADNDLKMLYQYDDGQSAEDNWSPARPQVILTHGAVSDLKQADIILKSMETLRSRMQKNHPGVEYVIIRGIDGPRMVKTLSDPNTVGLVFVAHGYKTKTGTPLLGTDGYPLPSAIISAATPSLRFVAFFACEGGDDNISRQYQAEYELNRLPGRQIFLHSKDKRLGIGGTWSKLISGSLNKRLQQFAEAVSEVDLTGGSAPTVTNPATLKIEVKDVVPFLEPRFIFVNGKIIGTLQEAKEFIVQNYPIQTFQPRSRCQSVAIMSAELSFGGSIVDDYMISSTELEYEGKILSKNYGKGLHIGDDEVPVTETASRPGPQPTKKAGKKAMDDWLATVAKWVKYSEWIDRDQNNWTPLKSRIYSDCL